MGESDDTKVERLLKAISNRPYLSVFIVLGICLIGLASALEAGEKLWGWLFPDRPVERIFADCRLGVMPTLVPPEGRIYVLLTSHLPAENGGGGLMDYFGTPGSEFKWTNDKTPAWSYRCELTNHSQDVLFNVSIPMRLVFRQPEVVPNQPKARSQGAVTLDREWLITIPKIAKAPDAPYVFYVWNCCVQRFVKVSMPETVTLADGTRTLPLVQAQGSLFQALNPVPFN